MTPVEHMKWWGWGQEGTAFRHDDKPALRGFVRDAIGLDIAAPARPAPAFDDITVPSSRAPTKLVDGLAEITGTSYVTTGDMDRVVHTYGKSLRDLLRVRAGDLPRVPDVVVYPADEAQVQSVVDLAVGQDSVVIAFGGGSNISGSLEPPVTEERTVISLDVGRLNQLLEIDAESGLARVQAGTTGPDLERQLNERGWTMGHFPDSFTHSTLGGWVATRSSGMQSDKYGDICDIVRGLRMVTPERVLALRPLPATSTGPSVREMVLGSEGRLGVITEATVQVHRVPDNRIVLGYLLPSWDASVAAVHEIARSETTPSVIRVSDGPETGFSMATRKKGLSLSSVASKVLMRVLARRGWQLDEACMTFIGFEGSDEQVDRQRKQVKRILARHGGIVLGAGPGQLYDQKKFDTPYIRDFLLDRGAAADVSETAAPWSQLRAVYDNVRAAAHAAYDDLGVNGWIMCHLSHSYHSGACLYFTFAFAHEDADALEEYATVKNAIQQAFVDSGATLSHHHAVGTEHARWLAEDVSPAGADLVAGLLASADPQRIFNPGKIVTDR